VPFSQGIVRHSFYIQLLCSLDVVRQRYGDNDNWKGYRNNWCLPRLGPCTLP